MTTLHLFGTKSRALTSAFVVGGLIVGAALVPAASASAFGSTQESCGSESTVYSPGKWTYGKAGICVHEENNKLHYRVVWKDLQYYWGSWKYNHMGATIIADVVLMKDNQRFSSKKIEGSGSGKEIDFVSDEETSLPMNSPGVYEVVVQTEISGVGGWPGDASTTVRSDPIAVPHVAA